MRNVGKPHIIHTISVNLVYLSNWCIMLFCLRNNFKQFHSVDSLPKTNNIHYNLLANGVVHLYKNPCLIIPCLQMWKSIIINKMTVRMEMMFWGALCTLNKKHSIRDHCQFQFRGEFNKLNEIDTLRKLRQWMLNTYLVCVNPLSRI